MKPRKIILLCACVALLAVAIVQVIGSRKNPVKILSLKEEIDEIKIMRPDGDLNFTKKSDGWVVGDKEYAAMESVCDGLVETFSSVRILDKVAKTDNENVLAKYSLDPSNVCTVNVFSEGNLLRTYYVGKTSSTNSQTYMRIDNASDVYLVSGSIQNDCTKRIDEVRSKIVFEMDKNEINTISVQSADGSSSWALTRSNDGTTWSVSGSDGIEIDAEKATNWFQSCSSISCLEWLPDDEDAPGENIVSGTIAKNGRSVTIDIYQTIDEDGEETYWGKTSEIPYSFKLPKYVVQKFQKNPEDFGI